MPGRTDWSSMPPGPTGAHASADAELLTLRQHIEADLSHGPPCAPPAERYEFAVLDPRPIARAGIARVLGPLSSGEAAENGTVLCCADVGELLQRLARAEVELAVIGIGSGGLKKPWLRQVLGSLAQFAPHVPVVLLADDERLWDVVAALRLGLRGYILTSSEIGEAKQAIALVRAGGTYVPASVLAALVEQVSGATAARRPDSFTPRERQVLELLRRAKSNKLIAHELGAQLSTVKVHVRNIMQKLSATNRTEAALFAQHLHEMDEGPGTGEPTVPGRSHEE